MRSALAAVAALLFTMFATPCGAQDIRTVRGFLFACNGQFTDQIECMAYITGVRDGIRYGFAAAGRAGAPAASPAERKDMPFPGICVTAEVTTGRLRDVVVQHLQAHPQPEDADAAAAIAVALAAAYPCRK